MRLVYAAVNWRCLLSLDLPPCSAFGLVRGLVGGAVPCVGGAVSVVSPVSASPGVGLRQSRYQSRRESRKSRWKSR